MAKRFQQARSKPATFWKIVYDGINFRLISNEKHKPKFTGVLTVTDPAPSVLLTNTTNTAAPTTARLSVSGNNAALQVGAANTVTVSANNMTVAGSINATTMATSGGITTAGLTYTAAVVVQGAVIPTNINFHADATEHRIQWSNAQYFYGNTGEIGLYIPAKSCSAWDYNINSEI